MRPHHIIEEVPALGPVKKFCLMVTDPCRDTFDQASTKGRTIRIKILFQLTLTVQVAPYPVLVTGSFAPHVFELSSNVALKL